MLAIQALAEDEAAVYAAEKRLLHADGHTIWVSLQIAVIRDGAGGPQHLLVQLHDTSERRREEERLRTLTDRDELTLPLNPHVLLRATTAKDAASRAGGGRALLFGPAVLSGPPINLRRR